VVTRTPWEYYLCVDLVYLGTPVVETLRVLVTGGAGFIGSHLVRELVSLGYEVRVLDNLSRGSLENLGNALGSVELVLGDVRDPEVTARALTGVDAVVHLAALIDVEESIRLPELYTEVNLVGTLNLVRASRRLDTFVFSSSASVYGDPVKVPIPETHPLSPKSPYAASKAAAELYIKTYSNLYGFRYVILRLFNVYGPRQSRFYSGVVVEFVRRALRGEPPVIYGDGEQTRDFVYVSDVVKAIVTVLKTKVSGVYNIGSGKPTRIIDLAYTVLRVVGAENLRPEFREARPGDVKHSVADISKATRELGFRPTVNLEAGLRLLADFYKRSDPHSSTSFKSSHGSSGSKFSTS